MKSQNVLVTPTLLDAYEFATNAPPSWKARAMNGFIGKIRREKGNFPSWVHKGIAFEDTVYRVCKKAKANEQPDIKLGSKEFQAVANRCYGGNFQSVLKKTIEIEGLPVLYYGKTDVDFPDEILDLKTTLVWKGDNKYLKGWQHRIYLWASGKEKFEYVVAEWVSEYSDTIKAIHTISYEAPVTVHDKLEKQIIHGTREMFTFLHNQGLWDDFFFTFSNNNKRH